MTDKMTNTLWQLVGYASGIAAGDGGCGDGPYFLQRSDFLQKLNKVGVNAEWITSILAIKNPSSSKLEIIADMCIRLANISQQLVENKQQFVVIGGDHSSAIGTWSGVAAACRSQGPLGLIWIDAHLDSHTPDTSLSGNIHGMPVACLLGYGESLLTEIAYPNAKILPQNMTIIGARSFENPEDLFLEQLGVRVFYMDEIQRIGIAQALVEAHYRATQETAGFGISIDLDALDPKDAPGVGSPAPDGMHVDQLSAALSQLADHPDLLALEFAEFNPHRDRNHKTVKSMIQLFAALAVKKSN